MVVLAKTSQIPALENHLAQSEAHRTPAQAELHSVGAQTPGAERSECSRQKFVQISERCSVHQKRREVARGESGKASIHHSPQALEIL